MFYRDEFDPTLRLENALFTFVLGMALGLVIAGLYLAWRERPSRRFGVGLAAAGVAAGAASGLLALDAGPWSPVTFKMKPYAAELLEASGLAAAALAGAAVVAVAIAWSARPNRVRAPLAAAVVSMAAVGLGLAGVSAYNTRGDPRHPHDTDTSRQVEATRVIEGLDVPVGLALAPNGDLATVELVSATFRLYRPAVTGFEQFIQTRLPVAEGRLGLHVAFHPDYPTQPYVYVTAEDEEPDDRYMHLLRGQIKEGSVKFETLLQTLPIAKLEESGDHFGSAIAICGGYLFLSTGDTEAGGTRALGSAGEIRHRAQELDNGAGKILRWKLEGVDLAPAPVTEAPFPVFALGFRNPFGMTCDGPSGNVAVAENGGDGNDQVRIVTPGSNHEWPLSSERTSIRRPLFDSGGTHLAPTGIAAREGDRGLEFIVSAFFSRALYALPVNADGTAGRLRLLREVDGGAYAVAADAAGCVYFTDAAGVWRLDDGRCR